MPWILQSLHFCITSNNGFFGKSKHKIENSNIPSALRPICHDDSMPVPEQPEKYTLESEPESEEISPEAETSTREDRDFSAYSTLQPHLIPQAELNGLVRDLVLPKTKAQLLGSLLQQWNLLEKGVKVSFYRKRQSNIAEYNSIDGDLVYCKDVCGLMEELQVHPAPEQWRFFINLFWRQFYYIMQKSTVRYLLFMQFTWKNPTPTFKVCWKKIC